jgi:CheY-like chemotaxis protein/anti-sigma regulatory factor (Ser/Thr protein kinase)
MITGVPLVTGTASRLEQVVINLLLNALQSLRTADPTRETIEVTVEPRDDMVAIAIRDTGRGIPAAVRDRIFDPFFTTKPVGEGTGLGLSICKAIVEGFGGRIVIDSTEGAGTTATVLLAIHESAPIRDNPPSSAAATRPLRVLVVDDDALVRSALARLLDGHHEVTAVSSGAEAVAAAQPGAFDVILCDMMMPGLDGRAVHGQLAAASPGLERRIVFITGGTFAPGLDEFLRACGNACLLKPFGIEDVLAAIAAAANS